MKYLDLFEGVVVIVDDKIYDKEGEDIILDICQELEEADFPLLKYKDIPDDNVIKNFKNLSFIILDWGFVDTGCEINIGQSGLKRRRQTEVIEFIKTTYKYAFLPIFIFSNQAKEDIIAELEPEGLYDSDIKNNIFIQKKDRESSVLDTLTNWISDNSSIYVLKQWEKSISEAKKDLFWSFYKINPNWPKIITQTIIDDNQDLDLELGAMITKNMSSRVDEYGFEETILKGKDKISEEDVRNVLEGEKFINGALLNVEFSYNGDIYFDDECQGEKKYYLNIRPQCDCRGSDHDLYCIRGREVDIKDKKFIAVDGHINEKVNQVIVYGICGGKTIEFLLKEFKVIKFNTSWKEKRVGRLLPPYMTRINQKFSFYILREGIPRLPDIVIKNRLPD